MRKIDRDVTATRWRAGVTASPPGRGTSTFAGSSWTLHRHDPAGLRLLRVLIALAAAFALLAAGTTPALASDSHGEPAAATNASVIVVAEPGQIDAATDAVDAAGGRVGAPLGVIDGFVAAVPDHRVDDLQADPSIRVVRANAGVDLSDGTYEDIDDGFSLLELRKQGVDNFESDGAYGQGVDVAVIDSGVTPVAGLDQSGKVIHGPDLSNEAGFANLAHLDTYGHGTHLAGIIAGDDGTTGGFRGMATGARIVSLKVAGATGETNVAQIIAAIDWVVEHRNTDGLNIRVLNLSLGLDDVPTHLDDPLSAAVERAWNAGIVVVVAAGNRGNTTGGLDSPAVSPYVIAVGATEATTSNAKEDIVPTWTSGGNGLRNPDFVAPGRSLVSLRVPGSYIDARYPQARVGDRFFKGSGTSQAAAVMSGWVALALSADPTLTPDQVKYVFGVNTEDLVKNSTLVDGKGRARADKARKYLSEKGKAPVQSYPSALGATSTVGIAAPTGATWSNGTWTGATWSGGNWNGATWSGATWSGATWSGATWSGATWSGATWSGATWSGATWSGATWSGATWSGATWSGQTWTTAFWD